MSNARELAELGQEVAVSSDGYVGVNEPSPTSPLEVRGSVGMRNGSFYIGRATGTTQGAIEMYNPEANPHQLRIYQNTGVFGGTPAADNTQIQLYSGAAYNMCIDGTYGVSFDNGGNWLDDYEYGTYTPTLLGYYGSNPTYSTSSATGDYIKIGDHVTVLIRINFSSVGNTSGGEILCINLPFATNGAEAQGSVVSSNLNWARTNSGVDSCNTLGTAYIGFLTALNAAAWGWEPTTILQPAGGGIRITISYIAA